MKSINSANNQKWLNAIEVGRGFHLDLTKEIGKVILGTDCGGLVKSDLVLWHQSISQDNPCIKCHWKHQVSTIQSERKPNKMYPNTTDHISILSSMDPEAKQTIHYSRPTTIFAAVAASIFTVVGVTGIYFSTYAFSIFEKFHDG